MPRSSGLPADSAEQIPEVNELYRRLQSEMRRPKPGEDEIAVAMEAAQRLAAEMDAEDAADDAADDAGGRFGNGLPRAYARSADITIAREPSFAACAELRLLRARTPDLRSHPWSSCDLLRRSPARVPHGTVKSNHRRAAAGMKPIITTTTITIIIFRRREEVFRACLPMLHGMLHGMRRCVPMRRCAGR